MLEVQSSFNYKKLIRDFIVELIIYGFLVVGYFLVVLRLFNNFLTNMFENNLLLGTLIQTPVL